MGKIIIEVPYNGNVRDIAVGPDEITVAGNAVYRLTTSCQNPRIDDQFSSSVAHLIYQRGLERQEEIKNQLDEDSDTFTTKE